MDCNKDEAVRAKQIAETKMKNNDFEGARKIVLKAQNLYPGLENITQLLSICDVHCSAQKSVQGSEKDWYGILQVERFADELAVKKQYRRLALFLHPDKNRFPGAEAAFKLICEANAVLSDPTKKTIYDSKIRMQVRSTPLAPPPDHMNKSSQFTKLYEAHVKASNGFSSLNQHQATQTGFSVRQEVFWTICPFCKTKYQYDRKHVNTSLGCQTCFRRFTAYEIGAQCVPMASKSAPESAQKVPAKPNVSQSSGFQEKGVPNQGRFTTGVQNGKGTVQTEPVVGTASISKGKQVGSAENVSGDLKAKVKDSSNINSSHSGKEGGTCNTKDRETSNIKSERERGKTVGVESKESDLEDVTIESKESDLEDVIIEENCNAATDLNSGPSHARFLRRSSRKKQNVSYNEGADDDGGLPRSPKRPRGSKLPEDNGNVQNDALDGNSTKHENKNGLPSDCSKSESKEMGTVYPEESFQDKDDNRDKGVKSSDISDIAADATEIKTDSDQDSYSGHDSDENLFAYDDPEFSDFDKGRDVSCFAVNQVWACYDSVDGMPRFYAKVKKIRASPFELCFTWLEADPADDAQMKWVDEELPAGCGNFKLGETETTSALRTFSHQVQCENGKKRGSLIIHPRKGEVWVLLKDWDLSWSSDPENHREYKYEVVEVLSDFDADVGISVCYLDKIGGYVSLFQRSSQSPFTIRPNELYKFSHCIPFFEMKGSEGGGRVPKGSFELDPAALPPNPDDLYYPGKAKMGADNTGSGVNCVTPKSHRKR